MDIPSDPRRRHRQSGLYSGAYSGRGRRIERELSGYFDYRWPWDGFDGDNRLRNGNWRGNSTCSLLRRWRNYLCNGCSNDPFNRSWNDLFNLLRDILFRFAATICIFVFSRRLCRTHLCGYKWRRRFALANRCCNVFGHRLDFTACFEILRHTLRAF
jgi:hypothetical protein